jgi:hypothetical protein
MMLRRAWMMYGLAAALVVLAHAAEDPGQTRVARLKVAVYFASDKDPAKTCPKALPVSEETAKRIASDERLVFKHYRLLGEDTQPLLRSYESWAEPLKPSDEVLVRLEAQGPSTADNVVLDVELWLARKKILKADARLEREKPLFMLGPEWRGGHLIIAISLVTPDQKKE